MSSPGIPTNLCCHQARKSHPGARSARHRNPRHPLSANAGTTVILHFMALCPAPQTPPKLGAPQATTTQASRACCPCNPKWKPRDLGNQIRANKSATAAPPETWSPPRAGYSEGRTPLRSREPGPRTSFAGEQVPGRARPKVQIWPLHIGRKVHIGPSTHRCS